MDDALQIPIPFPEPENEQNPNPNPSDHGSQAQDFNNNETTLTNHEPLLSERTPSPPNPTQTTPIVAAENPSSHDAVMEDLPAEISKSESQRSGKEQPLGSEEPSTDSTSETPNKSMETVKMSEDDEEDDDDDEDPPPKKQKQLSLLPAEQCGDEADQSEPKTANGNGNGKKSKKKSKNNNVWAKPASRKGKKKTKSSATATPKAEDSVMITPVPRFPDKTDDLPDMRVCLSKVYKAEKVELSEDRLCAGSCKGYRMVRATRGVSEGAWYFEIKVVHLGETGHTRLGWSTEKGDLQAPVGYDGNSFGYRDIDGSKIHKALRERYGEEGYKEGDVIGFYISLPEGGLYAPKQKQLVLYKGQRYVCAPDAKEDPPKIVPGSEISFFKNGKCQGVAYRDLSGGRYFPAASMYTLPNQPNCMVKFNFGPDFEYFPDDFEDRPPPKPMSEVPYQGLDNRIENGESSEKNQ